MSALRTLTWRRPLLTRADVLNLRVDQGAAALGSGLGCGHFDLQGAVGVEGNDFAHRHRLSRRRRPRPLADQRTTFPLGSHVDSAGACSGRGLRTWLVKPHVALVDLTFDYERAVGGLGDVQRVGRAFGGKPRDPGGVRDDALGTIESPRAAKLRFLLRNQNGRGR